MRDGHVVEATATKCTLETHRTPEYSADANERLARESELQGMSEDKAAPAGKGRCASHRALRSTRGSLLSTSACPGEVGSGSPTKDMRQDRNLQRFRGRAHQRV